MHGREMLNFNWANAFDGQFLLADGGSSGRSLLIPPIYDILFSLIALAILFIFFLIFVVPKASAVLENRKNQIEGELERAASTMKDAREVQEKYTHLMAQANTEAEAILQKAKEEADSILVQRFKDASDEISNMFASAKKSIEIERKRALVELQKDVVNLVVSLSSTILTDQLRDEANARRYLQSTLSSILSQEEQKELAQPSLRTNDPESHK